MAASIGRMKGVTCPKTSQMNGRQVVFTTHDATIGILLH